MPSSTVLPLSVSEPAVFLTALPGRMAMTSASSATMSERDAVALEEFTAGHVLYFLPNGTRPRLNDERDPPVRARTIPSELYPHLR